jgi:hypothetical protein
MFDPQMPPEDQPFLLKRRSRRGIRLNNIVTLLLFTSTIVFLFTSLLDLAVNSIFNRTNTAIPTITPSSTSILLAASTYYPLNTPTITPTSSFWENIEVRQLSTLLALETQVEAQSAVISNTRLLYELNATSLAQQTQIGRLFSPTPNQTTNLTSTPSFFESIQSSTPTSTEIITPDPTARDEPGSGLGPTRTPSLTHTPSATLTITPSVTATSTETPSATSTALPTSPTTTLQQPTPITSIAIPPTPIVVVIQSLMPSGNQNQAVPVLLMIFTIGVAAAFGIIAFRLLPPQTKSDSQSKLILWVTILMPLFVAIIANVQNISTTVDLILPDRYTATPTLDSRQAVETRFAELTVTVMNETLQAIHTQDSISRETARALQATPTPTATRRASRTPLPSLTPTATP